MVTSPSELRDRQKRSVDNLQRLYAFVVGLSVAEALRRTITDPTSGIASIGDGIAWANLWTMLATVVPFFHGANRYLDATYVTGERVAVRYALLLDFLFMFAEGILLFAISLLITAGDYFYVGFVALLGIDVVWVISTVFTGKSTTQPDLNKAVVTRWAIINLITIFFVLAIFWSEIGGAKIWRFEFAAHYMLALLATVRSALDYFFLWDFYYPNSKS